MESRVKLFGHPIHVILVALPLGLLVGATIFDVVFLITGDPGFVVLAAWLLGLGVLSGLIAAPFGTFDWLAIPKGTRAKRVGAVHGAGNLVMLAVYALSFGLRISDLSRWAFVSAWLSVLGLVIVAVTGWLGGELVYRLGMGVYDDAHLNAPSSLTGKPAGEGAKGPEDRRAA